MSKDQWLAELESVQDQLNDALSGVDDESVIVEAVVAVLTDTDFVSPKALNQIVYDIINKRSSDLNAPDIPGTVG